MAKPSPPDGYKDDFVKITDPELIESIGRIDLGGGTKYARIMIDGQIVKGLQKRASDFFSGELDNIVLVLIFDMATEKESTYIGPTSKLIPISKPVRALPAGLPAGWSALVKKDDASKTVVAYMHSDGRLQIEKPAGGAGGAIGGSRKTRRRRNNRK